MDGTIAVTFAVATTMRTKNTSTFFKETIAGAQKRTFWLKTGGKTSMRTKRIAQFATQLKHKTN